MATPAVASTDVRRTKGCLSSAGASARISGAFCRQHASQSEKGAPHRAGSASVGGGADEILKSARITGLTS